MRFKKLLALALGGALAALTACGGNSTASGEDSLRDFTIVLDWYPNAIHSFLYNAIENGYYAAEGLNVQIQFPSNENDALSLVAAGQADVGMYYPQYMIQARADQNVPVKSIGAVVQKPLSVVLSLKDQNITSPKDLVGKNVGYGGSALSEALVRTIMENVGADASDVTMTNVGFDLMSSMTTGNVDVTIGCMLNHEVPQLEEEGFAVNYFSMFDYGVPEDYELVFVANDKTIETDADTLRAFLHATQKGFEDMKNDPQGSLKRLLGKQNADNFPLTESVEQRSMDILLPVMETAEAPFLSQTEAVWQTDIDWMAENGLISKKPAVSDVMADLGV